ncbi:MAG: Type leader peptidase family [Rubritepida sp.]|nr:Type leader peptidase family [Rubritepida sp.]
MPSLVTLLDGLAAAVLTVLAITDLRSRKLPREWMFLLIALTLLRTMAAGGLAGLAIALASGAIAAGPIWALRLALPPGDPRWRLGGGDLRLAFALGIWLGALPALFILAVGSALAGLFGLAAASLGRGLDRSQPLGTWCIAVLAAGWLMTWL